MTVKIETLHNFVNAEFCYLILLTQAFVAFFKRSDVQNFKVVMAKFQNFPKNCPSSCLRDCHA
jgi:hypothetical protein